MNLQSWTREFERLRQEFEGRTKLAFKPFWDNLTGFDVVKFDEAIKTPDGVSTADHCEVRFGVGTATFIRECMALEPRWRCLQ